MKKVHINLLEGQKIFLTSDLHVGHANILRFCNRPFLDIKDMSKGLIENWNRVVEETDIVFDLGDMFWWDSRHDIRKFIDKLNGVIYKVPGNHDMDIYRLFELCRTEKVTLLDDVNQVFVAGLYPDKPSKQLEFWVSHIPMATWPHFEHAPSFFGHIHSGPLSDNAVDVPGHDLLLKKNMYDVGVDNNNYTPIELRDALKKINRKEYQFE